MSLSVILKKSIGNAHWQDCRVGNTGVVVYYNTDPISELPIREVPDDAESAVVPEPHYESGTYGYYGCSRNKIRSFIYKSKCRYLFFMTKYTGTNEDAKDKLMVTGYYRIIQTADVKKFHTIYCTDASCMDESTCTAFRADEVHFVSLEDAYLLTKEVLTSWAFTGKITRQTRIELSDEKAAVVLEYLRSKTNQRAAYIAETKRLMPVELLNDDSEEG